MVRWDRMVHPAEAKQGDISASFRQGHSDDMRVGQKILGIELESWGFLSRHSLLPRLHIEECGDGLTREARERNSDQRRSEALACLEIVDVLACQTQKSAGRSLGKAVLSSPGAYMDSRLAINV